MLPPDLAFAQYFNATSKAYVQNAPAYITYRERTHIEASGPLVKASRDVNRSVALRQRDNVAIMKDLPDGAETTGQAFPIIPYFDPMSNFTFSYFVNLKAINITIDRQDPPLLQLPQPDPSVDAVVYYLSFWHPAYDAGSTESAPRFRIEPVAPVAHQPYPAEVRIDAATGLPSFIDLRLAGDNLDVQLDYAVIAGHWIVTHGRMTSQQGPFHGVSETFYDQYAFPQTAPDPRLSG